MHQAPGSRAVTYEQQFLLQYTYYGRRIKFHYQLIDLLGASFNNPSPGRECFIRVPT